MKSLLNNPFLRFQFSCRLRQLALALVGSLLIAAGHAQGQAFDQDLRIGELSALDRQYMDQQRARVQEITSRFYGSSCCRDETELDLLQRLLDDRLVRPDQLQELQAMGVVLGDLLADELDMHWVVYEDKLGRSRALRYRESEHYLFPVTMISRRREAGNLESVTSIYENAVAVIQAARPPLPFE